MSLPTVATAQRVTLAGLTGPTLTVTADDLKAMPHRIVTATIHGLSGVYDGVPLTLLLAKVGAPEGEALRGPAMSGILVVKACDGYRVSLALPDVDPVSATRWRSSPTQSTDTHPTLSKARFA